MSYVKQTWASGDIITSAKLNHMEDGIAGSGTLVVNAAESGGVITMDKTWQEIYDAFPNVSVKMVILGSNEALYVSSIGSNSEFSYYGVFTVRISDEIVPMEFVTDSADGYPSYTS